MAAVPSTPISILAKKRDVSASTVRLALKEDLGLASYQYSKRCILTSKQRDTRLTRAKLLVNDLKSNRHPLIFSSDKKMWNVDAARNRQNDRFLAKEKSEVPYIFTSKNPASIMTLGVISNQGHVMPPHFFKLGERVNTKVYLDVLETVVVPWMIEVAMGEPYTFQQDSAPCHVSKRSLAFLEANIPHFWPPKMWPSNSPDANLLDYYF